MPTIDYWSPTIEHSSGLYYVSNSGSGSWLPSAPSQSRRFVRSSFVRLAATVVVAASKRGEASPDNPRFAGRDYGEQKESSLAC